MSTSWEVHRSYVRYIRGIRTRTWTMRSKIRSNFGPILGPKWRSVFDLFFDLFLGPIWAQKEVQGWVWPSGPNDRIARSRSSSVYYDALRFGHLGGIFV